MSILIFYIVTRIGLVASVAKVASILLAILCICWGLIYLSVTENTAVGDEQITKKTRFENFLDNMSAFRKLVSSFFICLALAIFVPSKNDLDMMDKYSGMFLKKQEITALVKAVEKSNDSIQQCIDKTNALGAKLDELSEELRQAKEEIRKMKEKMHDPIDDLLD